MMAIFFSTTKGISSRDALLTGNKGVLNMPDCCFNYSCNKVLRQFVVALLLSRAISNKQKFTDLK
ncbi:hypothetical protein BLOT_015520 [Blomia tropicalis]|nr:hypothetical protein BLOT_015520 [Blomia tropicalis]